MSAKFVRETYNVTYQKGDRLVVDGRAGTLVSFPDQYLGVRFDGEKKTTRCHPTWRVEREPVVTAEPVDVEAEKAEIERLTSEVEKKERARKDINAYAILRLKNAADKIEARHSAGVKHQWYALGAESATTDLYDGPGLMTEGFRKEETDLIVTAVNAVPETVQLLRHVVTVVEVAGWDSDWDDSPLDALIKSALDLADQILKEES